MTDDVERVVVAVLRQHAGEQLTLADLTAAVKLECRRLGIVRDVAEFHRTIAAAMQRVRD